LPGVVAFCGAGMSAATPLSLPTTYQFFKSITHGGLHSEHPMTAYTQGGFKKLLAYLFNTRDIAKYDLELLYRYLEWVLKAEKEFLYPTAFLFQTTASGNLQLDPSPKDIDDDLNSRLPLHVGHYNNARVWIERIQEALRRSFNWEYLVRSSKGKEAAEVYSPLIQILVSANKRRALSFGAVTAFTLNWDTSWEAIAVNEMARKRVSKILGISIDDPPFLNGFRQRFDERVYDSTEWSKALMFPGITLIRLHGSILWRRSIETGDVYMSQLSSPEHPRADSGLEQCLIYPGGKTEAVSTHPWDSLLAQFRDVLQQADVLLIIGYSFRDKHINDDILKAMESNKQLRIISANPDDFTILAKADADAKGFFEKVEGTRLRSIVGYWPDTQKEIALELSSST
jgi:hypothetical protein